MIGINDWSMIDSGPHKKPMIGFFFAGPPQAHARVDVVPLKARGISLNSTYIDL